MAGNTPVTTRLEPADLGLLDELVAAIGRSRQDVMRQMLREGHERHGGLARARLLDALVNAYGSGALLTIRLGETDATATIASGKAPEAHELGFEAALPPEHLVTVDRRDTNGQATLELVDVLPPDDDLESLPARITLATVPARAGYAITVNIDDLVAS